MVELAGLRQSSPLTLTREPPQNRVQVRWGWSKPNGDLKDMTCRVALLRMQADGLITLPTSRMRVVRKRAQFPSAAASDAQTSIKQPVHELQRITLEVVSGKATSLLWNEYIARYHYSGYAAMSGSQIRYNVFAGDQLVACISFGASAWKLKDRERFIGWSAEQRQKNLQLVINNARFLVLPWIQSKGMASKILSLAARQLPRDWKQRYGFEPVLLETFVEYERHKGTCYKAAKLDQRRAHRRQGKEIHQSQDPHPSQRYLALPASQKLRRSSLPKALRGDRNFTYPRVNYALCGLLLQVKLTLRSQG